MANFFGKEKSDITTIWNRIINRDFSGGSGLAIKNSSYNFLTTLIAKGGSFLFTIILARLLMPDLFGLYNLALSTILLFSALSDLGIGATLSKFIPKKFRDKKLADARSNILYLAKIKLFFLTISIILLILFSKYLSEVYYQKPIFLALLAGGVYIMFVQLTGFLSAIFQSLNSFKEILYKETIFQFLRIILVPLAFLLINKEIFVIILTLSIAFFLSSLFLTFLLKKRLNSLFKIKSSLKSSDKKAINHFLILSAAIMISGVFFGSIDMIMLGHFVLAEFIGFYSSALTLIESASSLINFRSVFLPLFSGLKKNQRENGFNKTRNIIFLFGLIFFILLLLFSRFIVLIAYGSDYLPAINILRLFSILVIIIPLAGIYSSYYLSANRPGDLTKWLVLSTLLNISLNYLFISQGVKISNLMGVYGAVLATIISQSFYLIMLIINKKTKRK